MLLAGIILKITVYILIRVISLPFFVPLFVEFKPFFLSVSVITALVGAFGALLTTDLKRIVAYSSVSHMGIIMSAGFFIVSNPISLYPFIVLLLTHTIVSTAMFMMVGCIYKSRYVSFISRNKLTYGGLLYIFPNFFLFGIIIFSNLNIPLTMGFTGELGTLVAITQSGLTIGFFLCLAAFILLLPMVSMLGQVLMGPIRVVDFFHFNGDVSLFEGFYLKSIFNKVVWSKSFLTFYYNQYLYFFSTVFVVIIFGLFPFLFAAYLEPISLEQAQFFYYIFDRLSTFQQ
jgi:NADH-quinone oxidoreductase subunit M